MIKTIYLLCGVPGVGKSSWARADKAYTDSLQEEIGLQSCSLIISRDEVRFSLLSDEDEYFAKENEVFELFIKKINDAICKSGIEHIYVDATHITPGSRQKVLSHLLLSENVRVVAVNFFLPLNKIKEQNAQREGRAKVPEDVVEKMFYDFIPACEREKNIDFILNITGEQ